METRSILDRDGNVYTVGHREFIPTAQKECPMCHRPLNGFVWQYVTASEQILWHGHLNEVGGCCGSWMADHPVNRGKAPMVFGPHRDKDRGVETAYGFRTGD